MSSEEPAAKRARPNPTGLMANLIALISNLNLPNAADSFAILQCVHNAELEHRAALEAEFDHHRAKLQAVKAELQAANVEHRAKLQAANAENRAELQAANVQHRAELRAVNAAPRTELQAVNTEHRILLQAANAEHHDQIHSILHDPRDVTAAYARELAESDSTRELITNLHQPLEFTRLLAAPAPPIMIQPRIWNQYLKNYTRASNTIDQSFALCTDGSECTPLSALLVLLFHCQPPDDESSAEAWASYIGRFFTSGVWKIFDQYFRVGISCLRNLTDPTGMTQELQRSDEWIFLDRCMMFKSVHKQYTSQFEEAKNGLVSKMREWNSIVLRGLPMLPCCVSAGCHFQYFVLLPSRELRAVSPMFDLRRPVDRINLFVTSINMFRILCSVRLQNQNTPHSAPEMLVRMYSGVGHEDGYVFVDESVVVKKCRPASDPSIYRLLSRIPSHAIQITNSIPLELDARGFAHLKIIPICAIHPPANLGVLKKAISSVLNALVFLHQNGFIHRDVRWPNVLCDQFGQWLLSDFELSSRIGVPLPAQFLNNSHFAPEVRSGEPCGTALDIWQVGRLIQTWLVGRRVFDQQLLDFSNQLANEDVAVRPDAATALNNACLMT